MSPPKMAPPPGPFPPGPFFAPAEPQSPRPEPPPELLGGSRGRSVSARPGPRPPDFAPPAHVVEAAEATSRCRQSLTPLRRRSSSRDERRRERRRSRSRSRRSRRRDAKTRARDSSLCRSKGRGTFPYMEIGNLRFTQDTISSHFKNGKSIHTLVYDLTTNKIGSKDIEPLTVVQHEDKWWSLDNRRLYALKCYAGLAGKSVRDVEVRIVVQQATNEFFRKMTTKNDGKAVKVNQSKQDSTKRYWGRRRK